MFKRCQMVTKWKLSIASSSTFNVSNNIHMKAMVPRIETMKAPDSLYILSTIGPFSLLHLAGWILLMSFVFKLESLLLVILNCSCLLWLPSQSIECGINRSCHYIEKQITSPRYQYLLFDSVPLSMLLSCWHCKGGVQYKADMDGHNWIKWQTTLNISILLFVTFAIL